MLRFLIILAFLIFGCGQRYPLIQKTNPINGATNISVDISPSIHFGRSIAINGDNRAVVLFDITQGSEGIGGKVIIEGLVLTYMPTVPLVPDHRYELVLKRQAFPSTFDEEIDPIDASQSPSEPLEWPLHFTFSTGSAPRVHAAYLDNESNPQSVLIDFSQEMDILSTGPAIRIYNESIAEDVFLSEDMAWTEDRRVRVHLEHSLDPSAIYELSVGEMASAKDGVRLDGNSNGVPGEAGDGFFQKFTGAQAIIRSRWAGF